MELIGTIDCSRCKKREDITISYADSLGSKLNLSSLAYLCDKCLSIRISIIKKTLSLPREQRTDFAYQKKTK